MLMKLQLAFDIFSFMIYKITPISLLIYPKLHIMLLMMELNADFCIIHKTHVHLNNTLDVPVLIAL